MPFLVRTLCTGRMFYKVSSIRCWAVDIRPKWPSHISPNSDSISIDIGWCCLWFSEIVITPRQFFWSRFSSFLSTWVCSCICCRNLSVLAYKWHWRFLGLVARLRWGTFINFFVNNWKMRRVRWCHSLVFWQIWWCAARVDDKYVESSV